MADRTAGRTPAGAFVSPAFTSNFQLLKRRAFIPKVQFALGLSVGKRGDRLADRQCSLPTPYFESLLHIAAAVTLCTGADDIEAAIERADRAMYGAKLDGRNRTICLEPVPDEASERASRSCSPQDGNAEPLAAL